MLDESSRLQVLAALGIDVYRLRTVGAQDPESDSVLALGHSARLAVACAGTARRDARLARRIDLAIRAIGVDSAQVAWAESAAGATFDSMPPADAYLLCGAAAARVCSALLPLDRQNSSAIAVSAEPAEWMRDGNAKRALWQALKPLARSLRNG
jgi:DNA polymerase III psi subunit